MDLLAEQVVARYNSPRLLSDSPPRHVLDDLHARIASSKLVVIHGAGHLNNLEAPERFNVAVREFLKA